MKFFLTIAASDTSGGAGITQDIRVAEKLGYACLCAITAITTQNSEKVFDIFPTDADILDAQLNVIYSNFSFNVLKVGVIVSNSQIHTVSKFLQKSYDKIKILDTVFASSNGTKFLSEELIETYKSLILPYCSFITPNKYELELLLKRNLCSFEEATEEAILLSKNFCCGIIVKGGHFNENEKCIKEAVIYNGQVNFLQKRKLFFKYSHGTGCAFSSAFAIFLSETKDPVQSAKKATLWVNDYFKMLNKSY